jgi:hypothetical protein
MFYRFVAYPITKTMFHFKACVVLYSPDIASSHTQQETPFLAAAILSNHTATGADSTENTISEISFTVA